MQAKAASIAHSMSWFSFSKTAAEPHTNNFELGQHGRNRSNVWTYPGINAFQGGAA